MAQWLLELFSEEIPARMQSGAAKSLERMAGERLLKENLPFDVIETFAGPRRLTLVAEGLPERQPDRIDERRGPRVGAPAAALEGFLRTSGARREDLIERDGAYHAVLVRPGRAAAEVIAEMARAIVTAFPWPKSMNWGSGALRWVRPLHGILCVFDRKVVEFSIDGLASGDLTEGHRVMGVGTPFRARDFGEYREALAGHFVVLEAAERRRRILEGARALCADRGLALVEDEGLLEELTGMSEWPTPILGAMDPAFLDLPAEVIRTSMRTHQRYFAVRETERPRLAPYFVTVANIEASDGGALIAAGNARVLSARLEDARFFWTEDRRFSLESRLPKLEGVTFHARLGTMRQRVERIEALASAIAPITGADPNIAAVAARLAKADLVTAMVGEFPELQGVMGGYYARGEGLDPGVADAIADHYRPQGPGDAAPAAPIAMAVALADKIDTILGFFSIDEKPTGSRDPFALRRAALGVIRIIVENKLRAPMGALAGLSGFARDGIREAVIAFILDRYRVLLREQGVRPDIIEAVFALGDDDLVRIRVRIDAIAAFAESEAGADLLAGYKRACNILNAEAKKAPLPTGPSARPLAGPAEQTALLDTLRETIGPVTAALAQDSFESALVSLAALRGPVDAFFDKVLVNDEDPSVRADRLRLLIEVRDAIGAIADFSLVKG